MKRSHAQSPLRKFLLITLIALATVAPVVVGVCYMALKKLTFAGDRVVYGKSQNHLVSEIRQELLKRSDITEITYKSTDQLKLSGMLIRRTHPRGNVVLCHGYKNTKELMYGCLDLFPDWNILLFDFRGHGQSEGMVTSIGCNEYRDVIASANYLREHTQPGLPLLILGISMGGAATLKAVEKCPALCDALIIDSAYSSLSAAILKVFSSKSGLPYYPFFPIVRYMFHYFADCDMHDMNPIESVETIKQPILLIHSCDDSFISPKHVLRLYSKVQNKQSKLWIGPSCRHGWLHTYYAAPYKKKVTKFIKNLSLFNTF